MILSVVTPWMLRIIARRAPDFVVGDPADPYLHRWWLIPRNRFFNIYLHQFLKDDDDRALHDHPWSSLSWMLHGALLEHLPGGRCRRLEAGDLVWRSARFSHRLSVLRGHTPLTLFITGPRVREWGFHCPQGWRPWKQFVDPAHPGRRGPGCD